MIFALEDVQTVSQLFTLTAKLVSQSYNSTQVDLDLSSRV